MGVHIGATWQIRLNRPCAAATRPFCEIRPTLTTCYSSCCCYSHFRMWMTITRYAFRSCTRPVNSTCCSTRKYLRRALPREWYHRSCSSLFHTERSTARWDKTDLTCPTTRRWLRSYQPRLSSSLRYGWAAELCAVAYVVLCYVIPMLMTLVLHLCSPCNRRTINFYDDDDVDDDELFATTIV